MKTLVLLALAGLSVSACATPADHYAGMVEDGYATGALGSAAIVRGDWAAAEAALQRRAGGIPVDDPARLINLGRVYMATNRPGAALSAWRLALASGAHYQVETADGRMVSTRALAQTLLAHHDREIRSATR